MNPLETHFRKKQRRTTVVGDRGLLDFIVWIIVTLDYPGFLGSLLGDFLARLATKDLAIYVTADLTMLHKRTPSTPYQFLLKEEACYNILAKYYASHIIDTSDKKPKEALYELLRAIA
ncbi:MAG: hypothetical protein QXZ17_02220 [Nitrososphaerota archaeon]